VASAIDTLGQGCLFPVGTNTLLARRLKPIYDGAGSSEAIVRNLYLGQVNLRFGDNVFLPYSTGLLWAMARTDQVLANAYRLAGHFFLRDPIDDVVASMQAPAVLGLSCYIWNWEYNLALASAVKRVHPNCLVVFGGPQVPDRSVDFFQNHPFVDLLVHQEGEVTFSSILHEALKDQPDHASIPGITFRGPDGAGVRTGSGSRLLDLSVLPSPYLAGVFDEMVTQPLEFHASQETHRGCPYSCTFCDWGSAVFTKVRSFPTDRLVEEFEWFGHNRIELLYNCDANYGILKRDLELTQALASTKARYGFPMRFRAAYAKKSNQKIYDIARVLDQADMNKGVTLSLQSLDEEVLKVTKRSNIKLQNFGSLIRQYQAASIATYTELILGLPGETKETFFDGLDSVLEAGQHDSINIYPCMVLPNSELNDPAYRAHHKIETVRTPMIWNHASVGKKDITEYYDIVVATRSLSRVDWKFCYILSLMIQACHCLSLTSSIGLYLRHRSGLSYRSFYAALFNWAENNVNTVLGRMYRAANDFANDILAGRAVAPVLRDFGDIAWPPEEALFLEAVTDSASFYRELEAFLANLSKGRSLDLDDVERKDLVCYQAATVIMPANDEQASVVLGADLHGYLEAIRTGREVELRTGSTQLLIRPNQQFGGDLERYARDIVWYGRKGNVMRHRDISVA
jgi:putative methyltransferase